MIDKLESASDLIEVLSRHMPEGLTSSPSRFGKKDFAA
jgi:hypothetical protein